MTFPDIFCLHWLSRKPLALLIIRFLSTVWLSGSDSEAGVVVDDVQNYMHVII